MGLASTIARRSLTSRPGRTFFSILGIGTGIATVVAIFTLDYNTILGMSTPDRKDWRADIEVSPSVKVQDPRGELRNMPGVAGVTAFLQNDVDLKAPDGTPDAPSLRVRLFAVDPIEARQFEMYRLSKGDHLASEGIDTGGILVGGPLAERFGVDIGTKIRLARPQKAPRKLCVDGEMQLLAAGAPLPPSEMDFTVVGILEKEKLGHRSGGDVVIINHDRALKLYEGVHIDERYIVKRDPEVDIERLKQSLGEAWSYELERKVLIGQAADERAFRNGVRFAGLMAMVLGLFVIFHTLSVALLERLKEIGTLHALGATRRQIGKVFFVEAVFLAGGGAAMGLAGGIALAFVMLRLGITTLGLNKTIKIFEVPWFTSSSLALVGFAVALLGSIYPLLRMRDIDSNKALRGDDTTNARTAQKSFRVFSALLLAIVLPGLYFVFVPVIGEQQGAISGVLFFGLALLGLMVGLPLIVPQLLARLAKILAAPFAARWPLAGKMAATSILERPARVAVAAIGIAMVTAAYVSLKGMTRSLGAEVDAWAATAVDEKVFVGNMGEVDFAEFVATVKALPVVRGVERGDARLYSPFLVMGVPVDEISTYGPCAADVTIQDAMRSKQAMIVSQRLSRDLDITPGKVVHLETSGGKVVDFTVVAVADDYGYFPSPSERMYGVISDVWTKKLYCIDNEKVSRVAVRLLDGADTRDAARAIRRACVERFGGAEKWSFTSGEDVHGFEAFDITQDFALFDIIIALTAALAALGVLNGLLLAALERTKELGILKALGSTRGQIAGMVLLESLVVGIIGGAIGTGIGAGMTPVVITALEKISSLPIPYRSAGMHLWYGAAGAIVLSVLASLYPVYRMNRMPIVKAIRGAG